MGINIGCNLNLQERLKLSSILQVAVRLALITSQRKNGYPLSGWLKCNIHLPYGQWKENSLLLFSQWPEQTITIVFKPNVYAVFQPILRFFSQHSGMFTVVVAVAGVWISYKVVALLITLSVWLSASLALITGT